jgi:hypothetical protein
MLIESGSFLFKKLDIRGIDNEAVLSRNDPRMAEEECSLFHCEIADGNTYLQMLDESVKGGVSEHRALPVVRFADGEYAFYRQSLDCNGLYKQAESTRHIKEAITFHVDALKTVSASGWIAPLIFPGNTRSARRGLLSFLKRESGKAAASIFLDFLYANGMELRRDHYMPFYVVYAYLASQAFASLVDGRKLCIVNAEFHADQFSNWFAKFSSHPEISFVEIPDSFVATRWPRLRDNVLAAVPARVDLFLTGAGVGALPVCVDLASSFSAPAIDAGHVLNMMNGREDKSNGPRLYTLVKNDFHE